MYHPLYGRLRQGPPGYYVNVNGQLIPEHDLFRSERMVEPNVEFGAIGFTPAQLATSGVISGIIALVLGAGLPGALVMGLGSMIVESGSGRIPAGWRRYVLGLFRKPSG